MMASDEEPMNKKDEEGSVRLDCVPLPSCCDDRPPLPDGVTLPRPAWVNRALGAFGDVAFVVSCVLVIVCFFMLVGFGLQHWLSRIVWLP